MANRRPPAEADLDGSDDVQSVASVASVAKDFQALIEIFEHQLELDSVADESSRAHLANAKAAAERGARLSQSLLKRIRTKTSQLS